MNPKAIIFDVDDTLIKTIATAFKVHKLVGKKYYNLEFSDKYINSFWGMPFREMTLELYQHIDTFENIYKRIIEIKRDIPVTQHTNASRLLKSLAKKYFLGALTSADLNIITVYLRDAGLDKNLFKIFQTSEQTKVHKPNPAVFNNILKQLSKQNIFPENVLYVGDSTNDYQAAAGNNMHFVAITTGIHNKTDFLKLGLQEKYIIAELAQLKGLLAD